jgi:peptidoglycan biosynthesis protein MviN/MurJ (putative lipid II flippase)
MLIGIGFQSFLASRLGTGNNADAFYLGTTIPTLFATAFLGSGPSALIRVATETPGLLRLGNYVPRRLLLLSFAFSGVMIVGGVSLLVGLPLSDAPARHGAGQFLLLAVPVPPLALLASIGAVLALARQHFVIATYGGAVNGIGLLVMAVILSPLGLGPPELAIAVDCGYLLQLGLVVYTLRSANRSSGENPNGRAGLERRVALAFVLLAGASAVYKSQPLIERTAGAFLGSGLPASLGYADKITSGLMQLAVFGFALAALPLLSGDLAARAADRAVTRLQGALAATVVSVAAVVFFGLAFSGDLVRCFYQRGAFSAHDAYITHQLVLFALPSVALGALAGPVVSAFYAAGRVRQVALIGLGGFIAGTAATGALAAVVGYRGIVLGTGVSYAFTFTIFASRIGSILKGWSWRAFISTSGPAIAGGVVTAAVVSFAIRRLFIAAPATLLVYLFSLAITLGVILTASFGAFLLLRWRRPTQRATVEA